MHAFFAGGWAYLLQLQYYADYIFSSRRQRGAVSCRGMGGVNNSATSGRDERGEHAGTTHAFFAYAFANSSSVIDE